MLGTVVPLLVLYLCDYKCPLSQHICVLQEDFAAPTAVQQVDLLERHGLAKEDSPAGIVSLTRQLHTAPAGAFSNFLLGPGGATSWIHVISGKKVRPLISRAPLQQEPASTLLCYNCTTMHSNCGALLERQAKSEDATATLCCRFSY